MVPAKGRFVDLSERKPASLIGVFNMLKKVSKAAI